MIITRAAPEDAQEILDLQKLAYQVIFPKQGATNCSPATEVSIIFIFNQKLGYRKFKIEKVSDKLTIVFLEKNRL